jgi:hypothetical protein
MTDIGRRYFGGEIGDASWSESTKRRASDDDVTLEELSVSSPLLKEFENALISNHKKDFKC